MAMTSSDERIEIAGRMRGPFDMCECVGHTYINGTLYGMQVCARDELALRNGMRRLADLMDPTCRLVRKQVRAGGPQMYKTLWCCSRCGLPLAESKYKGHMPFVADNFCPRCGARVTDGGER